MRKGLADALMTAAFDIQSFSAPPSPASLIQAGSSPGGRALALFLDLDGVLAPIEARPALVGPDPARTRLIERLDVVLDGRLAVLSGRELADVDRILEGRVRAVAGVHGLERRRADGGLERQGSEADVALAAEGLARELGEALKAGVEIENKGLGVAVHYRNAPAQAARVRHVATFQARALGLVLQPGHQVVELKGGEADKGQALMAFLAEPPFLGSRPVMIGDDRTDEAAFRAAEMAGGFGILVDPRWHSAARHALADTGAVRDWLTGLIGGRS